MSTRQRASNDKPGVFETIRSDLKSIRSDVGRTGVKETVRQTFADLDHFYLDEGQQLYLARVGAVRRWFWRSWWLLKSLFLRLAPARRVLLLLSFVLLWVSVQGTVGPGSARIDLSFLGVFLILMVLLGYQASWNPFRIRPTGIPRSHKRLQKSCYSKALGF